jgi:hypothetical protein
MRFLILLLASYSWAQSTATQPPAKKKAPATPKELGAELVNSAFDTAGSASAGAQPYLLWRIADVLAAIDSRKALDALNQAFADAAILGANSASLQSMVARSAAELDLPRTIEMLRAITVPYGSYDPRESAIGQVVGQRIAKNQINAAVDLLNLLGGNGPYPYAAVGSILAAVPNEDDPRRLLAFGGALTGYQAHPGEGFGRLLTNYWEKLPRPIVTHALDVIVETVTSYKDEDSHVSITYIGAKGQATLSTDRDAQLFQILVPLQACEPEKVKDLFDKYPDFKTAAQLFPNGNNWKDITGMSMSMKSGSTNAAPNPASDFAANSRLVSQAVETASKDLPAGIDLAKNIQNPEYRGEALRQIAAARADSNPSTAHDLLEKAVAAFVATPDGRSLDGSSQYLLTAFGTARKLKDDDLAREIVDRTLDLAARLYKVDSDSDDPNLAPVDFWPSLHIYREAMRSAVILEQMKAPARLQTIRNTDVFLFCQVAMAAALLDRYQDYSTSVQHAAKN